MVSVLLAEDNIINQKVIIGFCQNKNWPVTVAKNGIEVIDKLKINSNYDVILMDIQMPQMNGIEATKIIRQQNEWKDIPIIAVTAHALRGDEEKFLAAGMNGYVKKPIDFNYLENAILNVINNNYDTHETFYNKENSFSKLAINTGMPEELVKELAEEFIEMYKYEVAELLNSIDKPEIVKNIAHKLKGAISNFGFNNIQQYFYDIELNCAQPNMVKQKLNKVNNSLNHFKQELENFIKK